MFILSGRVRRGCLCLPSFYSRETYHSSRIILENHFSREAHYYPEVFSENHFVLVKLKILCPLGDILKIHFGYPENPFRLENLFF